MAMARRGVAGFRGLPGRGSSDNEARPGVKQLNSPLLSRQGAAAARRAAPGPPTAVRFGDGEHNKQRVQLTLPCSEPCRLRSTTSRPGTRTRTARRAGAHGDPEGDRLLGSR